VDHRTAISISARLFPAALAGALLLAAGQPGAAGGLPGQAVLSQPFPLPADAVLDVQLIERVGAEASTVLRGRSRAPVKGRTPFVFMVPYLDGAIQPAGRYSLRATIRQADRLLFSTGAALPVLNGKDTPIRLLLEPVGDAPLRGLTWLQAPAASVPTPPGAPRQEQQFRLDPLTRELTGSGDCNRFIGTFALQGDTLRLEPAGGTMLECEPDVKADEARFLADLLKVRRWRLDGQGRLELLDEGGGVLLLMETRPL
jgi:putative lipoprotein